MRSENQKEASKRLKIVEGHLKKVRQMVEEGSYCIDILQQSLAVQQALKRVDELILSGHLESCVVGALGEKKKEKIQEVLEIFRKSRR